MATNNAIDVPIVAGGGQTYTFPAATDTLVGRASTDTLTNKTLTSPVINTPTGIVKGDVGLGNVDNTSDAGKPVSTATQTALDLKAPLASPTFSGTVTMGTLAGAVDAGGATSFEVPNGAGGTTVNATGEICVDSTSRTLNFYDGTLEAVLNPVQSKTITIADPSATEDLSMFYTDDAITVTKMVFVITGSTSATTTIRHHTDRSNAGNEVVTGGTVANSTTTGNVVTSFNDATIPADSFVWLETTALSGTPTSLSVTVFYRQDA